MIKNFIIFILIISCNTEKKEQNILANNEKAEKPTKIYKQEKSEKKHCYIKDIYQQKGKYYIKADYVDFLFDEQAVEKAKQNGDAEFDISETGDTIYFVYNDYYVSNQNPRIRTLEISKNAPIQILDFSKTSNYRKLLSIMEFKKEIEKERIMILEITNGIVIKMTEQYTP